MAMDLPEQIILSSGRGWMGLFCIDLPERMEEFSRTYESNAGQAGIN
jgi:hypothetical protein